MPGKQDGPGPTIYISCILGGSSVASLTSFSALATKKIQGNTIYISLYPPYEVRTDTMV